MKVTRGVIEDLLPLYVEDEASADTRALVEAYLTTDPEFASEVRAMRSESVLRPTAAPPSDLEAKTFRRARSRLRWRGFLLGTAIFLSLLPLSVNKGVETSIEFPFLTNPWLWGLALIAWLSYFSVRHALRGTKL